MEFWNFRNFSISKNFKNFKFCRFEKCTVWKIPKIYHLEK